MEWGILGYVLTADGAGSALAGGVPKAGEAKGVTTGYGGGPTQDHHADRTDYLFDLALHGFDYNHELGAGEGAGGRGGVRGG